MNLAVRSEFKRPAKRIARLFSALSLFSLSCMPNSTAVAAYREIEGCVFKEDPVLDVPEQAPSSTLYFRDQFRRYKVTALNEDAKPQEEKFDSGDRISLRFINIDTSLLPTGRESRRRQLEKELEDTISKSSTFVVMASPKMSVSAVLLEKTSPYCTG